MGEVQGDDMCPKEMNRVGGVKILGVLRLRRQKTPPSLRMTMFEGYSLCSQWVTIYVGYK
jgi:hypothetical protein